MLLDNSRRNFVLTLAALPALSAVKAFADTAKAPAAAAKLAPGATFKLGKNNLGLLSHHLFSAPADRQKFLSDPTGYAEGLFGAKLNPSDQSKLNDLRLQFASGLCCQGCGCSGGLTAPELERKQ